MDYIQRSLENLLAETIGTRALVYLNGMRQCGKSTLVQNLINENELNYVTFNNTASLLFARNDPAGFIERLPIEKLNVIDEVQLVPELFLHFKKTFDRNRFAGRDKAPYVLIGSVNLFAMPKLAGVRGMSILTLYPFSVSEIKGTGVNFMEKLWDDELSPGKYGDAKIVDIISAATFPEIAINRKIDRNLWFNDYIATVLRRDIRVLADIKNPDNVYRLLVSFSKRAGGLLNNENVMKETGLDAKTYGKYKALCGNTFLIYELPSWSKPNRLNKRFVKQKKLYFTDTALLCHLMKRDMEEIYRNDMTTMGHVFENFVAAEIMKAAKSLGPFSVSHFNPVQYQGREVDFVVESPRGEAIGIEAKLSATIDERDRANMGALQETIGKRFKKGIIIYTGTELARIARNIWAVPVNYFWEKN